MYGVPAYHTSKAAVSGLTRALAVNLAITGSAQTRSHPATS